MNLDHFGMDTITMAGALEGKLRAARDAGFSQIMISSRDLVEHPLGEAAAVKAIHESGLRVTAFQVLRDFEGLSGHLHNYRVDVAKAMLTMCKAVGSKTLLLVSSTSSHASGERSVLVRDLRKLATLAVPLGIRIAYEPLSWAKHVGDYAVAWEVIEEADRSNLGLVLDSFQILATETDLAVLEYIYPEKLFLVQLADFLTQEIASSEERMQTGRHSRVFPGDGVHSTELVEIIHLLDGMEYAGDYSLEVFNDEYRQLSPSLVAQRALQSVKWITSHMSRRTLPRLRRAAAAGEQHDLFPHDIDPRKP